MIYENVRNYTIVFRTVILRSVHIRIIRFGVGRQFFRDQNTGRRIQEKVVCQQSSYIFGFTDRIVLQGILSLSITGVPLVFVPQKEQKLRERFELYETRTPFIYIPTTYLNCRPTNFYRRMRSHKSSYGSDINSIHLFLCP